MALRLMLALQTRPGPAGAVVTGWPETRAGELTAAADVHLRSGADAAPWLRLTLDPAAVTITAAASGGCLHYFRLADATLRPLPPAAALTLGRGDAYIAVSPGALRLADSPAMARYLHLHDSFNAERLAEGLLLFLAQESGLVEFPEAVTVIVVEAR